MVSVVARDHDAHAHSDLADYRNDQDPHWMEAADIRHCENRQHYLSWLKLVHTVWLTDAGEKVKDAFQN